MGVVDDSRFNERAFEDALAGSGSESDEDPLLGDGGNDDDADENDLAAALAAGGLQCSCPRHCVDRHAIR